MPDLELEAPNPFSDETSVQISVNCGTGTAVVLSCIINVKNLITDPASRVKIQQVTEALLNSIPMSMLQKFENSYLGDKIISLNPEGKFVLTPQSTDVTKAQEELRIRLEGKK